HSDSEHQESGRTRSFYRISYALVGDRSAQRIGVAISDGQGHSDEVSEDDLCPSDRWTRTMMIGTCIPSSSDLAVSRQIQPNTSHTI
ncbi:unnamed protein product, partial [Mycena citricolor]